MTPVYIVTCQWLGDSKVAGVFSTWEKAVAYTTYLNAIHKLHEHKIVSSVIDEIRVPEG